MNENARQDLVLGEAPYEDFAGLTFADVAFLEREEPVLARQIHEARIAAEETDG